MAKKVPPHEPLDESESASEHEPTRRERIAAWLLRLEFLTYTLLVLILIALSVLWPRMFITIEAGHYGVMYRHFAGGTVTNRVWGEGLHVIAPWDKLTVYDGRLQENSIRFDVLSEEGLDLGVRVSVRYRLNKDMLGFLHKDIGGDYFQSLIHPEIQAHVRRTFGSRPAREIYGSTRDVLQELAQVPLLGKLDISSSGATKSRPYVHIQELKLTDIELPKIVEESIAETYRQEQLMVAYKYKLEREEKEAERKRTEAAGIRDYNLIANEISDDVLRWRNVEATLELAKSQNSKVVVLGGGGQGQVPMLLNLVDPAGSPQAASPDKKEESPQADAADTPAAPTAQASRANTPAAPAAGGQPAQPRP